MAAPSYRIRAIVLKKTKFGEADQIITLIDGSGAQIRLVAKGSRKPNSRSSAHLELFNVVEVVCVKGKSLDIATDTKLVAVHPALNVDPIRSAAASCASELLTRITEPNLEYPKLFDMSCAALDAMEHAGDDSLSLLVAAFILKTMALSGVRPNLGTCIICDDAVIEETVSDKDVRFSYEDGGCVCATCASSVEFVWIPETVVRTAHALLYSTYADIANMTVSSEVSFELLQLCQQWCIAHVGSRLKSLNYVMDMMFIQRS